MSALGDIAAVLFDLDDTLHPEQAFVEAGFRRVAVELERRGVGAAGPLAQRLGEIHAAGERQRTLQVLASEVRFPEAWIPGLVDAVRGHQPTLALDPAVRASLDAWRTRWPLGCVTDGRPETQFRKVRALGLGAWMDTIVITDGFGVGWRKPDPRPFRLACALMGVEPCRTLFVGDHPVRDVGGALGAGLRAVRVRFPRGVLVDQPDDARPEAEFGCWNDLAGWLDAGPRGVGA